MTGAGWISFLWDRTESIRFRRQVAEQYAAAECKKSDEERCDELNTSIRSAAADEDAVDVAVWQLWANMAGIAGLAATVVYARAAWRASHRSAEAANATLELGRAYVVAELGAVANFKPGECYRGHVRLLNVGQTPATNVSSEIWVSIVAVGAGGGLIPAWDDVTRIHLVIGSGREKLSFREAESPLTQQEYDSVLSKGSLMVLGGTTVYDDIFGKTWWTQFCHVYSGPELEGRYHTELNRSGGPI